MNGIVFLDKPSGYTSFEAVRAVRRIYDGEKAGHPGTLDPMATGVLPVFFGRATKLISLLPDTDKAYTACVKLGSSTSTGDKEGEITAETSVIPSLYDIVSAADKFKGPILQTPPMYSAKKQDGIPLYKLARQGINVERPACTVTIHSIDIFDFCGDSFSMSVSCSSGTYIRTLAEDIAVACGSLAHLTSLRRTRACGIGISECHTLEALQIMDNEALSRAAVSPESLFLSYPSYSLKGDLLRLFLNGFRFPSSRAGFSAPSGSLIRISDDSGFIGLGTVNEQGELVKLWQTAIF